MRKFLFLGVLMATTCLNAQQEIKVCSFNIKFVGSYKKKDHRSLATLMEPYDLVFVQELVSPPRNGIFPDGSTYTADPEAKEFVQEMTNRGFQYVLSEEDTGTGDQIHLNSSATEWFIAFYKPQFLHVDSTLHNEFLAEDRSNHPDFERVPYAFSFKTKDGGLDFTVISVHLQPGEGVADRARRAHELESIETWICARNHVEKDFLIVGDMNIYSRTELHQVLPEGYRSLNDVCVSTTMAQETRPYDHVMFAVDGTVREIRDEFVVIDLKEAMRPFWTGAEAYPENDMNLFHQYYSDHHPVVFTLLSSGCDDD